MTERSATWGKGIGALVTTALLTSVAACSSSTSQSTPRTTVTFAEGPLAAPDYIFPLASLKHFSVANLMQFQYLMYRPLYWFGTSGQVHLNQNLSLAEPPQFSADGKTITVTLKSYTWSDGVPLTARDIVFWQNMVAANKGQWGGYAPGEYPDNVVSVAATGPRTLMFTLSQAYGADFFTYNELSQITPMPQHVWDKQSASGPVGDYDMTPAGAQAVYKFLDSQASNVAAYGTNPLWQVVDGPWKLKSMDANGNVAMVPNTRYSGPNRPRIAEFDEVPFSKYVNEYNALRNGPAGPAPIDYGYLPVEDVGQKDSFRQLGYDFAPWTGWLITDFPENFTNPVSGPIFQQPYFRQAMQMLVNQPAIISTAFSGYAYPTYGPVPTRPPSTFTDATEQANPYPFDVSAAIRLLQGHGWTVNPSGVSTCSNPGTAALQCGAGINAAQKASFKLEYVGGNPSLDKEMQQLKSDFAHAGIEINLATNPSFEAVIANATPCLADKPCTWDMEYWGYGWIYSPDYYPTGDQLWGSSAPSNYSGWHDAMTDQLIQASETGGSQALFAYEDYIAKQLPAVWLPTQYIQLSEINSNLHGTQPQDPLGLIYPETWSWQ